MTLPLPLPLPLLTLALAALALTRSPFLQADEAVAGCVDAWDECDDPETPQVVELVAAPIP